MNKRYCSHVNFGTNPCSVAVMDNLSVHHVPEIISLFQRAGILVMFLPLYSPDLIPMEESFTYVKAYLRRHKLLQVVSNPTAIIQSAFYSITIQHCKSSLMEMFTRSHKNLIRTCKSYKIHQGLTRKKCLAVI